MPGKNRNLLLLLLAQVLLPWDDIYRENSEMLYPLLVVIGGDGTLHQVVSSPSRIRKNIPLGYIPAGSGNDFARGMRLP